MSWRVADWVVDPEVAVTMTLVVPAGVPVATGGVLPPLQPEAKVKRVVAIRTSRRRALRAPSLRRLVPTKARGVRSSGRRKPKASLLPVPGLVGSSSMAEREPVVMVRVELTVPSLAGVTEAGEKLQAALAGRPEQAKVVAPVKPKDEVSVILLVPLLPLTIVRLDGLRATVMAGEPTLMLTAAETEAAKLVSPA